MNFSFWPFLWFGLPGRLNRCFSGCSGCLRNLEKSQVRFSPTPRPWPTPLSRPPSFGSNGASWQTSLLCPSWSYMHRHLRRDCFTWEARYPLRYSKQHHDLGPHSLATRNYISDTRRRWTYSPRQEDCCVSLDVLNRGSRFAAIRIVTGSQRFESHDSNRKAKKPFESLLRLTIFHF